MGEAMLQLEHIFMGLLVHLVSTAAAGLALVVIVDSSPLTSPNPRPDDRVASWQEHQLLQIT